MRRERADPEWRELHLMRVLVENYPSVFDRSVYVRDRNLWLNWLRGTHATTDDILPLVAACLHVMGTRVVGLPGVLPPISGGWYSRG